MRFLSIFCGILLLIAIPTGWPYDFYIFLRWIIFVASIYLAYILYKSKHTPWTFIFSGIAFLFNPLVPIYLNKTSWVSIDFIASMIFFYASTVKIHKK